VFKQPPAMTYDFDDEKYHPNPDAENIDNLPGGFGYYENIIAGASPEFISIYVMNNYGTTFSGRPVYPMFSVRDHMLGNLDGSPVDDNAYRPEPRRPIIVGLDLGLNPAAAIGQENAMGGITCYDELVGEDIRFEDFMVEMLLPTLRARYAGFPVTVVYDPANPRSSLSKVTAAQMLRERGLHAIPAPSNDIPFRIEAVTYYLQRKGMYKQHPRCLTLREALAGGYHFEEVRGKNGVFKDEPTKGPFSHVANAYEYLMSYFFYQNRRNARNAKARAAVNSGPKPGGFHYA
jgi:hypothetical protein